MHLSFRSFLLFFFLVACEPMWSVKHRDMNPEQVVENYLKLALNIESLSQREHLMSFTSGELKVAIAGASDADFEKAYINERYRMESFSIIGQRERTPREVEINFRLVYQELKENSKDFEDATTITTENTVALIKEDGKWRIYDVLSNLTSMVPPALNISASAPSK